MANILLVDDSSFTRDRLAMLLTEVGHNVYHAGNGKQAIEKYLEILPDLVFMDINMPEIDGLIATQEILKTDPLAKVIILSAVGQKEMILKAIETGAIYFIVKPFDQNKILEAVDRFLIKS